MLIIIYPSLEAIVLGKIKKKTNTKVLTSVVQAELRTTVTVSSGRFKVVNVVVTSTRVPL